MINNFNKVKRILKQYISNLNFSSPFHQFLFSYKNINLTFQDFYCRHNFCNFKNYENWVKTSLANLLTESLCFNSKFTRHFEDFKKNHISDYISLTQLDNSPFYTFEELIFLYLKEVFERSKDAFYTLIKNYNINLFKALL